MEEQMGYSAIAHALAGYVEGHLDSFDLKEMSDHFGFSEVYLRELFLKHLKMPVKRYCLRRRLVASAFEILHSDKKIIDIALESGFANHESYTRAFRKVFHMPPSQFRAERPAMGGRLLEGGVFGLDSLVCEGDGREDQMMQEKEGTTILYGIRRIEHGAYGSRTMFPICVKAVSEYLGEDVSYAYIMAATGAAFRLVWNREEWDLSNIDIYHTLKESNEIYRYGAAALGREFSFLGREEDTPKEAFTDFIRSNLAKGYPVIALGIIGPPEPCIVAGYQPEGDVVMGWNFFQKDPEAAGSVRFLDNGYFCCDSWWENTDTQAVMCIGAKKAGGYGAREIVRMAADIMRAREDCGYAKGLRAYEAWKEMLLSEKWFQSTAFDHLFSKLLVQMDAMVCLSDGRGWAAEYFEELSVGFRAEERALCREAAKHFRRVSGIAEEMMRLVGERCGMEEKLRNFSERPVREKLGGLIDAAKESDEAAFGCMEILKDCSF